MTSHANALLYKYRRSLVLEEFNIALVSETYADFAFPQNNLDLVATAPENPDATSIMVRQEPDRRPGYWKHAVLHVSWQRPGGMYAPMGLPFS